MIGQHQFVHPKDWDQNKVFNDLLKWFKEGHKIRVADDVMTRLADFLRRRDVKLTVVVYPWPLQIAEKDLDSRQVRFWRAWAAKTGAGFIDLFPSFIDGRDAKKVYAEYFIPYDIHFNDQGHALVASKFLDHYR